MPLSVLLAAMVLTTPPPALPEAVEAPRHTVWLQPAGLALALGGPNERMLFLSAGLGVPVLRDDTLSVEVTVVRGPMDQTRPGSPAFSRVSFAVGKIVSSETPLSGWFYEWKVIGMVLSEPDYIYDERSRHLGGRGFMLKCGLDVGWQFVTGPLYGAVLLGASYGSCMNCPKGVRRGHLFGPQLSGISDEREETQVLDFNLNFLRLGTAF